MTQEYFSLRELNSLLELFGFLIKVCIEFDGIKTWNTYMTTLNTCGKCFPETNKSQITRPSHHHMPLSHPGDHSCHFSTPCYSPKKEGAKNHSPKQECHLSHTFKLSCQNWTITPATCSNSVSKMGPLLVTCVQTQLGIFLESATIKWHMITTLGYLHISAKHATLSHLIDWKLEIKFYESNLLQCLC